MKKNYKFSKAFLPCAIISAVIIVAGIAGLFIRGINFGLDFAPGLIQEVRIAPAAMEVTYTGSAKVSVELGNTALDLVISGAGANNETRSFAYGQYPTVDAMAAALSGVENVSAVVRTAGDADTYGLFANSLVTSRLSSDVPLRLYVAGAGEKVDVEQLRTAVKALGVDVKALGSDANRSFQIRARAKADDSSQALQENILASLYDTFGKENVAVVKQDFVGSQFSASLLRRSIILAVATIFLIWLYATIRFHWDFALGAVLALLHDCLVMFAFISWFQIEFSTTTLAAVLTIFGYSINATVVILDRVRENMKTMDARKFTDILDAALNGTFSRSIITTVTTLFASISLWVFTSGSIQTFAIVLTIGLLSGCYSSMFISSGFIAMVRRNWDYRDPKRVAPKKEKEEKLAEAPAAN